MRLSQCKVCKVCNKNTPTNENSFDIPSLLHDKKAYRLKKIKQLARKSKWNGAFTYATSTRSIQSEPNEAAYIQSKTYSKNCRQMKEIKFFFCDKDISSQRCCQEPQRYKLEKSCGLSRKYVFTTFCEYFRNQTKILLWKWKVIFHDDPK